MGNHVKTEEKDKRKADSVLSIHVTDKLRESQQVIQ